MQYIKKANTPPADWEKWFTQTTDEKKERLFSYSKAYGALGLKEVKDFLIDEQQGLCAFCQRRIVAEKASIEHIIPKSLCPEQSTSYFNLVAVCRDSHTIEDKFCDVSKGHLPIVPFVFLSNCDVQFGSAKNPSNNPYFSTEISGKIVAKNPVYQYFIDDVLNLNCEFLRKKRYEILQRLITSIEQLVKNKGLNKHEHEKLKEAAIRRIEKEEQAQEFRQFLLISLMQKRNSNLRRAPE